MKIREIENSISSATACSCMRLAVLDFIDPLRSVSDSAAKRRDMSFVDPRIIQMVVDTPSHEVTNIFPSRMTEVRVFLYHVMGIDVPFFYRFIGFTTMVLAIAGIVLMLADMRWFLTPIEPFVYIIWSLCCLSLHFTNFLALREWKKIHGKQQTK